MDDKPSEERPMPVEPRSLKELFLAALAVAPDERGAWLARVCGPDAGLRRHLELMLAAHDAPQSLLDRPAPPAAPPGAATGAFDPAEAQGPPLAAAEGVGAVIAGRYKLLEEIGAGGMGTVWMAQQTEPVKRVVAVKLIRPGMDSKQVLARFEAERQALALMDHPNIARVLDAGTTAGGRPFFVMELVKGVPITRYCDEHRLTPRQRLELFVPVCQAIQHAHQKGVIHRDVKPSNVLVCLYDGRPVPKVIDFGIAKAAGPQLTDRTLVTGFGVVVGTLEYMSPEQAEVNQQDVDTRSDVYSLGVLLYELLTGSTPLESRRLKEAAMLEVLRLIREEEPPRPSTRLSESKASLAAISAQRQTEPAKLTRLVRGELDWVVMKALEKDRNRRYETANGFALDVQRYLNDEPVAAGPPSAWYRFHKFTRRNRGRLAAVGVVGLALLLAVGGVGWAVRDREAREAAAEQERLDRAAAAERERSERRQRVGTRVEVILGDVHQLERDQKWPQALAAAERAEAALASGEADDATRERVRDAGRYLAFVARLDHIRQNRSAMLLARTLVSNSAAVQAYAQAFRDYGVDVENLPTAEAVARLGARPTLVPPITAALDDWREALYVMDALASRWERLAAAARGAARWERLVAVARGLDVDSLRNQLRAMWGRPITPEMQAELRRLAGSIDVRAQGPVTAHVLAAIMSRAGLADLATRTLQAGAAAHPADFWLSMYLGIDCHQRKDNVGAIRYMNIALALRPDSAAAYNSLGAVLLNEERLEEAIDHFHRAIECDRSYAPAHNNLGNALHRQGKQVEAEASCRKAIALEPDYAHAHTVLGCVLRKQERVDEAIAILRRALDLNADDTSALINLGALLCDRKHDYPGAIAAFRAAIRLNPTNAGAHLNLGEALTQSGDIDGAIAAYRKAIKFNPKGASGYSRLGVLLCDCKKEYAAAVATFEAAIPLDPNNAQLFFNLGIARDHLGDRAGAAAAYRRSLDLDPDEAQSRFNYANALWACGKRVEAVPEYRAAVRLRKDEAAFRYNLANALNTLPGLSQLDEAIAEYRQAIALRKDFFDAHLGLGTALAKQGRLDDAIAEFERATRINPKDATGHYNLGKTLLDRGRLDAAIAALQETIRLEKDHPGAHTALGNALFNRGNLDAAIAAYQNAIRIDANDAAAHNGLGNALQQQNQLDDAIVAHRKAIALNKSFPEAHNGLGIALAKKGRLDDALAEFDTALRINPNLSGVHVSIGNTWHIKKNLDRAITAYREAIRLDKTNAMAHYNLGNVLREKGLLGDAIESYRESIRLRPGDVMTRANLGWALRAAGKPAEAIPHYRAILLAQEIPEIRISLGNALFDLRQFDDAIAEYRTAIRTRPTNAEAYGILSMALRQKGEFRKALEEARRARDLEPTNPRWVQLIRGYEREAELDDLLPGFLGGTLSPATAQDGTEVARLCSLKRLNRAAVRFYQEAVVVAPGLADDLEAGHRYNAACDAALAGCGRGTDADPPGAAERALLRRLALDWLRADLEAHGRRLQAAGTADAVARTLQHWLVDVDFAGVRGPAALAQLPAAERGAWQTLWRDVADTLARARGKKT
jgi:tetratricopeptide (TPR) repeat protein